MKNKKPVKNQKKSPIVFIAAGIVVIAVGAFIVLRPGKNKEDEYSTLISRGIMSYNAREYSRAEEAFYKAVNLNPRSPIGFTNLANAYLMQDKDSLAIDFYRRALNVDPNFVLAKKGLATLYEKRNKIKELNDLVTSEIKKNPKAGWALHEWAYIHTVLNEYDQAVQLYEEAFQADTTDVDAIFLKGETYLTQDLRVEAAREFQRYLKYRPNSIEAHGNLGQIYARQMKYDDALRELNLVVRALPKEAAGYFNLASVYLQMGDLDKADSNIAIVQRTDPNFPGLKDVKKMLDDTRKARKH